MVPDSLLVSVDNPSLEQPRKSAYHEILKSSALIGGTTVLNIGVGIIRTKLMAMMLGPAGLGLMGAYTSIAELARSVAELGVPRSGVRQIAEAAGSGDVDRVARTVTVLRRVALLLGLFSVVFMTLLAQQIGLLTFGNSSHASNVRWLSIAVFFSVVAGAQSAVLQGLRRIGELARVSIVGTVLGTCVALPIIYLRGELGVVPALGAIAAASALVGWRYAHRAAQTAPPMQSGKFVAEAVTLMRLGIAFMVSGLLTMGASYAVRVLVLRADGLDGAGYYQVGWTLGGLYVGFILQAMGTDFYPRLVVAIRDHREANRLVNEQAYISILLAGPGVVATLVLSPILIGAFYSESFSHAVEVLRWICIGMALRVVTWPMGFIVVAKNRQAVFVGAELAWTVVNVGLSWFLVDQYGLAGAGMAFFGSYVFHAALIYPLVRHMTGFAWSGQNARAGAVFIGSVGGVFLAYHLLPTLAAHALGVLVLVGSTAYSLRSLSSLVSGVRLPKLVQRVLSLLRYRKLWGSL